MMCKFRVTAESETVFFFKWHFCPHGHNITFSSFILDQNDAVLVLVGLIWVWKPTVIYFLCEEPESETKSVSSPIETNALCCNKFVRESRN